MIEAIAIGIALFAALALVRHFTVRTINRKTAELLIAEIEHWLASVTPPVPSEG